MYQKNNREGGLVLEKAKEQQDKEQIKTRHYEVPRNDALEEKFKI